MMPHTQEWVDIAEDDYNIALQVFRARKNPSYKGACFHAQQCAEKYLKARLIEGGVTFPYTHNLTVLLNLLLPIEPSWAYLHPEIQKLTNLAVDVRYPGYPVTKADAKEAIRICEEVRRVVRVSLGL